MITKIPIESTIAVQRSKIERASQESLLTASKMTRHQLAAALYARTGHVTTASIKWKAGANGKNSNRRTRN